MHVCLRTSYHEQISSKLYEDLRISGPQAALYYTEEYHLTMEKTAAAPTTDEGLNPGWMHGYFEQEGDGSM